MASSLLGRGVNFRTAPKFPESNCELHVSPPERRAPLDRLDRLSREPGRATYISPQRYTAWLLRSGGGSSGVESLSPSAPSARTVDPASVARALRVTLLVPAAALSHRWAEPGRSTGCTTGGDSGRALHARWAGSRADTVRGAADTVRGSGAGCVGMVRRSHGLLFNPPLLALLTSLFRRLSAASRRICLAISKRREASSTLDRRTDAGIAVTCIAGARSAENGTAGSAIQYYVSASAVPRDDRSGCGAGSTGIHWNIIRMQNRAPG